MVARAECRPVVLGDVKVIGPRAQRVGDLLVGDVQCRLVLPVVVLRQQAVLFGIRAEDEQHRVRHVGLVADDAGHIDHLEEVHVLAPRVHAAPADLALGGEALAFAFRDLAGFAKGLRDLLGVALRILVPFLHADGGVDADAAARADADVAHLFADRRGFLDLGDEALAVVGQPSECK